MQQPLVPGLLAERPQRGGEGELEGRRRPPTLAGVPRGEVHGVRERPRGGGVLPLELGAAPQLGRQRAAASFFSASLTSSSERRACARWW